MSSESSEFSFNSDDDSALMPISSIFSINSVEVSTESNTYTFNPIPMRVGSYSIKNHRKFNQDYVSDLCSTDGLHVVSIVADGHGDYGHIASQSAVETIRSIFGANIDNMSAFLAPLIDDETQAQVFFDGMFLQVHSNVRQSFLSLNSMFVVDSSDPHGVVRNRLNCMDAVSGGTTLTVTVVTTLADGSRKIFCANVGDSDAILIKMNTADQSVVKGQVDHLSVGHSPDNLLEYERIRDLDPSLYPNKLRLEYEFRPGYINSSGQLTAVFGPDGTANPVPDGIYYTTVRKDYATYARCNCRDPITIAMTRAIGDFAAHQYGMTWSPSVSIHTINPSDEYAIVSASDGVWDCTMYPDFADYFRHQFQIMSETDANTMSLSELLCTESVKKGTSLFGLSGYDDTTISVIHYTNIRG